MDDTTATKKLLFDIQSCIQQIETYLNDTKVFIQYDHNSLLQDAVERNLITIGEAMNSLLEINPKISISNARRIVNVRNKLTHGYDEIDNVQIWNIIINHLPVLKREVAQLLRG
ncbi:MAG: DUF86 domain-containing protein [Bacteroidales bacterium]|nr:DUF86 domain-containing protein [Bacteroidales bacterium]